MYGDRAGQARVVDYLCLCSGLRNPVYVQIWDKDQSSALSTCGRSEMGWICRNVVA